MRKMYFTITGCTYRYGLAFFKPGMDVTLIKEPENKYDREAIRVEVDGLGTVGYVANSPKTVRGTSMSAGRLYDKIGRKVHATVVYVLPDSVICSVGEEANGNGTASDDGMESMPAEEEATLLSETVDLDLYSQEGTDYLISGESEDADIPADLLETASTYLDELSNEPPTASDDDMINRFETDEGESAPEALETSEHEQNPEDAASAVVTDAVATEQDAYDGDKTVSPEEIASALKAALAGLAAGGLAPDDEDPDAEYIYGNRSTSPSAEEIGSVLSEELTGMTPDNIASVLNESSGLSAADFFNVLTGTNDSAAPEADRIPEQPEPDMTPEILTEEPESELPEREERVSSTPGLNFNTVRFPEEEEGYVAPARETRTPEDGTDAENQEDTAEDPLPAAEDNNDLEEPLSGSPVEEDAAAVDSAAEPEEAELNTADVAGELPAFETPDATEAVSSANADDTEEEEADGITKPLVYDESELDENLSQLHLGDIDATYLSDSFLANLKKTLKEST